MPERPAICGRLSVLADPTRGRLLLVLERSELTVTELCTVLQLPQSTVSRHLRVLAGDGWLAARRDGTNRFYRLREGGPDPTAKRLWGLAREQVAASPSARQDLWRLESVLAERRARSRRFFASAAGEWESLRQELYGRHADAPALLAFLDEDWVVGDLGCGTGRAAEALAPFVRGVVAVDGSPEMLREAGRRLSSLPNIELRGGELEDLPLADGELDAAILLLALHYVAQPQIALREAFRALKGGGRLVLVDMLAHDREEYRESMGHVWLGFSPGELEAWTVEAGFEGLRVTPLPPDPTARGPALFAASTLRPTETFPAARGRRESARRRPAAAPETPVEA